MRDRLGRASGGVVNLGKKIALSRQAVRDQSEKVYDLMARDAVAYSIDSAFRQRLSACLTWVLNDRLRPNSLTETASYSAGPTFLSS
jgi:hypothetical protein